MTTPGPRHATIIDVARAAGVSRQTVTRALNGLPDISSATRQRVIEAAKNLNYRPNRAAQNLVKGREVVVGLVVSDLRNPYYPELASAFTRLAADRDWGVMLCDLGPGVASAHSRMRALSRRVDAVVGTHLGVSDWGELLADVPTVSLDVDVASPGHALVRIDYREGIRAALDHLTARGRRRIAMIDSIGGVSDRRRIYREYLHEHALPWSPASEFESAQTHQGGLAAADALRLATPQADAALVLNDVRAVGLLKGLARAGVAVPRSVAVVGIDGLDIGALVTPELTTVALDKTEVARAALELVEVLLSGSTVEPAVRSVAHTLVVRDSA
jgi:LacI family transcriptional regulator